MWQLLLWFSVLTSPNDCLGLDSLLAIIKSCISTSSPRLSQPNFCCGHVNSKELLQKVIQRSTVSDLLWLLLLSMSLHAWLTHMFLGSAMEELQSGEWQSQRNWKDIFATEVASRIERSYLKASTLATQSKGAWKWQLKPDLFWFFVSWAKFSNEWRKIIYKII